MSEIQYMVMRKMLEVPYLILCGKIRGKREARRDGESQ